MKSSEKLLYEKAKKYLEMALAIVDTVDFTDVYTSTEIRSLKDIASDIMVAVDQQPGV